MHADPQTLARGMVVDAPHSKLGPVKTLGSPVKLSATPTSIRRGAPLFGEHSREVLREIGYGEDEIDRLVASGAVRDGRDRSA
jgi:crotonobetainyl-CoA:carnitine CoA-transferase CaiB-like acyl-CoA transferase